MNFAREGYPFIGIATILAVAAFALAIMRRSWALWLFAVLVTPVRLVVNGSSSRTEYVRLTIDLVPEVKVIVRREGCHAGRVPADWQEAGKCTLPAPAGQRAKLSVQCYQGVENVEHWARINEFRVVKNPAK